MTCDALNQMISFEHKLENDEFKMMCLTEYFIQLRLVGLSMFVNFVSEEEDSPDWMELFGSSCLKRFSKLVEVYNIAVK